MNTRAASVSAFLLLTSFAVPGVAAAEEPVQSAVASAPSDTPRVGGFVDLEWRVMGLGGHVSHGPAFAAGATFFGGLLRVGIGGLGRPGPWNPATFSVTLDEGTTYRGQSELSLRSDGAMLGVHVALAFEVPRAPWLAIAFPLTVGYGGFGFYLHGDDRNTPDGRRVSEWENELFDGRDSHLGVVIDAGIRLMAVLPRTPWLRPYVAVNVTLVPGFDTMVTDHYSGLSGSIGMEVGLGL